MKKTPLVSVIVTTRNNQETLEACLKSIKGQTHSAIEILVIDNKSRDDTKKIAKKYTSKIYDKGPERSAQRNYGVDKSKGDFVLIIDSDMELHKEVVGACIAQAHEEPDSKAIIIPEESFGSGFWAQCKKLERSFYVGVSTIEAARFFDKKLYTSLGGYNESMTGAEDWEFSKRIEKKTHISRIDKYIYHNEGHYRLSTALKKKFYYASGFSALYNDNNRSEKHNSALSNALMYYKLYLSQPRKLFRNPFYGIGVLFMKTCEFAMSAIALLRVKTRGQS